MNNIFFSICLFLPLLSVAQSDLIENAEDDDPDEINVNKIFEHLRADPLDINHATRSELTQFFFLTDVLIDTLLKERPYYNKSRIKEILGGQIFEILDPYIQITDRNNVNIVISTQLSRKLDQYNKSYTGQMLAMTNALRLSLNKNISAGVLVQKDAGERSFIDHWSINIQWIGFQNKVSIIGGDFRLHVAQGLTTSSAYSNHKSTDVITSFRSPSSHGGAVLSSNENNAHRGFYVRFCPISWFFCDTFYSFSLHDVNNKIITGISQSGFHRTVTEKMLKDRLSLKGIGLRTEINFTEYFSIGMLFIKSKYDPDISPRNPAERRRDFYSFTGASVFNYSTFFRLKKDNIILSGEIARRDINFPASLISCLIKEKPIKIGIRLWYIPADYYAPFSTYSEQINNSHGFLFASSQHFFSHLQIDTYVYFEKKLWRTYFNPLPVSSKEYMIRSKLFLANKTQCILKYHHKLRHKYFESLQEIYLQRQRILRFDFEKELHQSLRLRLRFEYNYLEEKTGSESGTNFFHDIRWVAADNLIIFARYSSYYSSSYNSRMYEFENDLPYIFASRPLFGKGVKWYLIVKWKYKRKLEIQIKYHLYQKYIDLRHTGYLDTNREAGLFIQYRW